MSSNSIIRASRAYTRWSHDIMILTPSYIFLWPIVHWILMIHVADIPKLNPWKSQSIRFLNYWYLGIVFPRTRKTPRRSLILNPRWRYLHTLSNSERVCGVLRAGPIARGESWMRSHHKNSGLEPEVQSDSKQTSSAELWARRYFSQWSERDRHAKWKAERRGRPPDPFVLLFFGVGSTWARPGWNVEVRLWMNCRPTFYYPFVFVWSGGDNANTASSNNANAEGPVRRQGMIHCTNKARWIDLHAADKWRYGSRQDRKSLRDHLKLLPWERASVCFPRLSRLK